MVPPTRPASFCAPSNPRTEISCSASRYARRSTHHQPTSSKIARRLPSARLSDVSVPPRSRYKIIRSTNRGRGGKRHGAQQHPRALASQSLLRRRRAVFPLPPDPPYLLIHKYRCGAVLASLRSAPPSMTMTASGEFLSAQGRAAARPRCAGQLLPAVVPRGSFLLRGSGRSFVVCPARLRPGRRPPRGALANRNQNPSGAPHRPKFACG